MSEEEGNKPATAEAAEENENPNAPETNAPDNNGSAENNKMVKACAGFLEAIEDFEQDGRIEGLKREGTNVFSFFFFWTRP